MSDISPNVLGPVLSALGEQLASRGSAIHLVIIGGSGLLAAGLGDRATRDVDVVAFVRDGRLVSAAPFPQALEDAALRVANDFGSTAEELGAAATWRGRTTLPDRSTLRLPMRSAPSG
jgi:hypothetical protein